MRALCLWLFLSACCVCQAAPAPSGRRAKPGPRPPVPHSCVVQWFGASYQTTFAQGGRYEAVALSGGGRWVGWWSYDPGRRVLQIEERHQSNQGEVGMVHLHEVRMKPCLREGVLGSGAEVNFRLKEPR